jgi:CTP-dependent riboflavin kinase
MTPAEIADLVVRAMDAAERKLNAGAARENLLPMGAATGIVGQMIGGTTQEAARGLRRAEKDGRVSKHGRARRGYAWKLTDAGREWARAQREANR